MSEREMWPGADKRKAEIRARLAAATPGEWSLTTHGDLVMAGDRPLVAVKQDGTVAMEYDDARLIAAAPADLAYLLGEVERLERWKADATQAINDAMADMEWDLIPASECGETWAYVAELQRLIGHPLAAHQAEVVDE